MPNDDPGATLRIVLRIVGVIFVVGLYPLTVIWPDGFMSRQVEYEHMILITIAVLGVFLFRAANNPPEHHSLIAFAGWSSVIHGALMLVQAVGDSTERANLFGDVPALILIGAVLIFLNRGNIRAVSS